MIFPIIILFSSIIFIFSTFVYGRIYNLTKISRLKTQWIVFVFFIIMFLFGYLGFAYMIISGHEFILHELLITVIFFFGAVFVALTAKLFYSVITELLNKSKHLKIYQKKLKVYNDKLEIIVKERTKKMEDTLKKSIKKSREIQELRDQFIFIAAHELRSPVTAIKWNLEMIRSSKNMKNKCCKEDLELLKNVEESNNHLINLVNDLLDISRMEYGTFKINKDKCDLNILIPEIIKPFLFTAKQHTVEITYKKPKNKLPVILSDEKRIKEILVNLLSNAIKYNFKNGKVTITAENIKDKIIIKVIDTGIGIDKTEQKQLFKKFVRIDNEFTKQVTGTGLGLYIIKELLNKLGGKIELYSEGTGKGSAFTITLPVK